MSNRGDLYILSGPAGSGKTTLIDRLHQEFPKVIKNISFTTRPKRVEEVDGKDYFFISNEQFQKMLKKGEFLEHIELFGNRYGTSRNWILEKLDEGFVLFLVIDVMGAEAVRKELPVFSIFIRPPSLEVLEERLQKRDTEQKEQRKVRLQRADQEMRRSAEYDVQIVNDDLDRAYQELKEIVIKRSLDGIL